MVFEALRRSFRNAFMRNSRDEPDAKNLLKCKIALLDGTDVSINLQKQALGKDLVIRVLRHLDLVEKDFFGLQFMDTNGISHWLDPSKKVRSQVRIGPPFSLHFRVKFYAVEPHSLKEELTRYHFFMQLKQDIRDGKLYPTSKQAIELGAFAVQSELGDFDENIHTGNYVSEFRLMKDQTAEVEKAISRRHRNLAGMNPAECEVKYLQIAQKLEFYGMDRHEVTGEDGRPCMVGLTPKGVVVMKGTQKLGDHPWRTITNISFKQARFILCAKTNENEQEEYRFELPVARAAKHLWKSAVEYHSFFRLIQVTEEPDRSKPQLFSFGSRFRYSGRTLHQTAKDDSTGRKTMMFKRTRSERFAQRSTIGYIRIGSNVWAKALNGDYYKGQVTVMTDDKVHVKFDNGDTISHEKNDESNIVYDMPPNANDLKIGTRVIAHWSGVSAYLTGTISKIEGAKYHVLYEDGDKGFNRIEQMRILRPPLYFGPGSGRSNLQKKYSLKTTSLAGFSAGGTKRVTADVRSEPGTQKLTSASVTSDTRHEPSQSNSPRSSKKNHRAANNTNGNARSSGKSAKSKKSSHEMDDRNAPALNARMKKNTDTGKSYQITDL